jgi:WD40 repeat protein
VDVARERVAGSWLCRAGGTDASHSADGIVSVCFPGASTGVTSSARALSCAGARSGAVSFLDRRGGRLVAGFRAHDDAVVATAARGGDGAFSTAPYCLVTASRDETVAVWDVRMLTDGAFATSGFETSKKTKTPLLASFGGFGDGVRGMALRGADAFVVAGEKVSVFSLDDRPVEKQSDTRRQRERMSVPVAPLRLRAHGGAKVRARLTGVAALPRSRLFAVTDEDGKVRVCR